MIKRIIFNIFFSFFITYLTLFIPREVTVTRTNVLGCETSCEIVAAGFPMPYLVDGYTSPVGSISQNPLIVILTNTDIFSREYFFINIAFWYIIFYILFSKILLKRERKHENKIL